MSAFDRSPIPQVPRASREILQRVEAEYLEMPGLILTEAQAKRLWNLDAGVCAAVLTRLVDQGVLRRRKDGTYVRGASY